MSASSEDPVGFGVSSWRIVVDRDLCQGHGVCESEAPDVFEVSKDGVLTVLDESPPDRRPQGRRRGREVLPDPCPDDRGGRDLMPAFPREELEEMVERWLQANKDAEASGDWTAMARCSPRTPPTAGTTGPTNEFMAVGRDEIRDVALGLEMGGLDGWEYPYQEILIDERKGQVVGFWKQIALATRADGTRYEVAGIGGCWFGYAGDFQWRFAARLVRLRQRRRLLPRDDRRRHALRGHDGPHAPLARRRAPRPLRHRPGPCPPLAEPMRATSLTTPTASVCADHRHAVLGAQRSCVVQCCVVRS